MEVIKPLIASWEKKCSSIPLLFYLYSRPYKSILKKEIALADISENDYILNVGCGAMPFTAIYLAKLTGARILAIDKDEKVIEKAKETIANMGYSDKIEVLNANGIDINEKEFTVALVALQAEPKTEILENLLAASKDGTRMVFRIARDFFASQYDFIAEKYQAEAIAKQRMITFDKSVLFIK
ncbi:SAM-dependent methyltransferase [Natronospora cellulosivora (SeqCode)]